MDSSRIDNLYPIFNSLGWTLLHFLWQGTLVALLASGAMALLRGRAPDTRYLTMCAALVLMLLFPVCTFVLLDGGRERSLGVDETRLATGDPRFAAADEARETAPRARIEASPDKAAARESETSLAARFEGWLPWLVLLWLAGVLAHSGRFLIGWLFVQKLKAETTRRLTEWQPAAEKLARRLGVRKSIRLLESSLVKVPVAAGWLRPVILLPVGMVFNLTPPQLENIIAHELAHIRRHDYLVNIFQTFAEILLFYHPAVLWLSKQIRIEREYACDDLAIEACGGDAICYARALTKVERIRKTAPRLVPAATGGSLESRVRRLVDASYREPRVGGFSAGLIFLITFAVAGFGWQASFYGTAPAPQPRDGAAFSPAERDSSEAPSRATTGENAAANTEGFDGEDEIFREIALSALGARRGAVVVMNPQTGRLYTIVNQDLALRREWNPASIFKLVTGFAALNERKIKPDEKIAGPGRGGKSILNDALAVSQNDYFYLLGERVGTGKLLDYARRFGFGRPTGVNLPGEIAGHLPAADSGLDPGTVGMFGQAVKVTPLQLAAMMAVLANRGTPVRPFAGGAENPPASLPAPDGAPDSISPIVAGMRSAVERGTGKGAFNRSFAVAGKTGTADDGENGIGLFASFAPVENPRFVVVVALKEPKANGPAAAEVAGKIYAALAERQLQN